MSIQEDQGSTKKNHKKTVNRKTQENITIHSLERNLLIGAAFLLFFGILIGNLLFIFHDDPFAERQIMRSEEAMQIPDALQIDKEIREYLTYSRSSLETDFLNEKERLHLEDVRRLYFAGFMLVASFMGSSAGLFAYVVRSKRFRRKASVYFYKMASYTALILVFSFILSLPVIFDFGAAFTLFHEILFANDLWLMTASDRIIDLYEQSFFFNAALLAFLRTALIIMIMLIAAYTSNTGKDL